MKQEIDRGHRKEKSTALKNNDISWPIIVITFEGS
jgi:hypothetical protein